MQIAGYQIIAFQKCGYSIIFLRKGSSVTHAGQCIWLISAGFKL